MAGRPVNGSEGKAGAASESVSGVTEPDIGEAIPLGGESGIPVIEPETIQFEPEPGEQSKRRGRKPGSKNVGSKASEKQEASDLAGLLYAIHEVLALLTSTPEFNLSEAEAQKLGASVARVNKYYGKVIIPEKYLCWGNLFLCMGGIYGTRLIAYSARISKEQREKKSQVINIPPGEVRFN